MGRRLLGRGFALLAVSVVAIAIALVPMTTASAHEVSDITASCDTVKVFFSGFPAAGVTVHIAASVEGHGTLGEDVFVDNTTTEKQLDISSATGALEGTTANVDVDVTWTFEGPQHVHRTFPMTCGTATTTTAPASSTTATSAVEGASVTTSTSHASVLGASVTAAPAATSGRSLPSTGSPTWPLVVFAIAAIAAGTALVAGQRSRRSTNN